MKSREYYAAVQKAILDAAHVIQSDISFDEISEEECYIRGLLLLSGGYQLHIAEYVVTEPKIKRLKYRFHLQTASRVPSRPSTRWRKSQGKSSNRYSTGADSCLILY